MAEAALERLREAIIMGELTPGTPLRLEDLARNLGMSISPIREAVRQDRASPFSFDAFEAEVQRLIDFARERSGVVRDAVRRSPR